MVGTLYLLLYLVLLTANACENEWTENGGNCYWFGNEHNFTDAHDYCHGMNADIVTVLSEEEETFIKDTMNNFSILYSHVGVTGFNYGVYQWNDGALFNKNMFRFPESHNNYYRGAIASNRDMLNILPWNQWNENEVTICKQNPNYQGCYLKNTSMIPDLADYSSMSLTLCKQLCLGQRKKLALVHPTNCYCVDDLSSLTSLPNTSCTTPCPRNKFQLCGGENALRAYKLDYSDITDDCSVLYDNGLFYQATYLLRNSSTGENHTSTCGFIKTGKCEPDWVEYNETCLLIVTIENSLSEAHEACEAQGAVLYTPVNDHALIYITDILAQVPMWALNGNWHLGALSLMKNSLFQTATGQLMDLDSGIGPSDMFVCLILVVDPPSRQRVDCQVGQQLPYICVKSSAYLGCKAKASSTTHTMSLKSMNVGQCVEYCRGQNTSQAGVVNSTCNCFNDVTTTSSDGLCNATCSDILVQSCGSTDGQFMSLYGTGISTLNTPASCSELLQFGVAIPSTYVIYPQGDALYTECFITGEQYSAILTDTVGEFTASSALDLNTAEKARIGFDFMCADVWKPGSEDHGIVYVPWIQVKLDAEYVITALITQGDRNSYSEWTTSFNLTYGNDGEDWKAYPSELPGNVDSLTPMTHFLVEPIIATYVRLVSITAQDIEGVALRLELLGQKYKLFDADAKYVGCFGCFNLSDYNVVEDLTSIEGCQELCNHTAFYGIIRRSKSFGCVCADDVGKYGRRDSSVCTMQSRAGNSMSGSEELHSLAVYRTFVKSCPVLQPITNGIINSTNRRIGSAVIYQCNAGFEISPGLVSLVSQCLETKQWSREPPTCISYQCPVHPNVLTSVSVDVCDDTVKTSISLFNVSDQMTSQSTSSSNNYDWSNVISGCLEKGSTCFKQSFVDKSQTGKKSVGDLHLVTARSKFDCAVSCVSHDNCHSYNYNAESGKDNCELVLGTGTHSYETDADWDSYKITAESIRKYQ